MDRSTLLGTKAEVLSFLRGKLRHSTIAKFKAFPVGSWLESPTSVLTDLVRRFAGDVKLIVRSSAIGEEADGMSAGALDSECNIPAGDREAINHAIAKVVASFTKNGRLSSEADQVLVQEYIRDVRISGVILTWDDRLDQPYYLINYDSVARSTSFVTSGKGGKLFKVFKDTKEEELAKTWRSVVVAVKEIEGVFEDSTLDIEFAIDQQHKMHVFQVRKLTDRSSQRALVLKDTGKRLKAAQQEFECLAAQSELLGGKATIFSDMADWNPAELLGARPRLLDRSLYQRLITDQQWNHSRVSLGYTDVGAVPLMVTVGDKPYIDARVSLHSLTPAAVPSSFRKRLVDYGIRCLAKQRELHDKVEFTLAFSCFDFSLECRLNELGKHGFVARERNALRRVLRDFTNALLRSGLKTISSDLRAINNLRKSQLASTSQATPLYLLNRCQTEGVHYFTRLARLAFVALALLKSLVREEIIAPAASDALLQSLSTFPRALRVSLKRLQSRRQPLTSFLQDYGHLRPMAYDITAKRYDQLPSSIWTAARLVDPDPRRNSNLEWKASTAKVARALRKHGFAIDAPTLFTFIRKALEAREYAKFVFTRDLSDALECISSRFALYAVDRNTVANLSIDDVLRFTETPPNEASGRARDIASLAQENASIHRRMSHLALPSTIAAKRDIALIGPSGTEPNFVTQGKVIGRPRFLASDVSTDSESIRGAILLFETADPGFDWVFLHDPMAIITQYGGAGSHMAVRCGAYNLPAAIGCGEHLFEMLKRADSITLDCANERVAPLI